MVSEYEIAVELVKVIEHVHTNYYDLLSPLGISILRAVTKTTDVEFRLDDQAAFPDMPLASRAEFFRSALYCACCQERAKSELAQMQAKAKKGEVPDADSLKAICLHTGLALTRGPD